MSVLRESPSPLHWWPPRVAGFERLFRDCSCEPELDNAQADQREMFAAPEQFTVEHKGGHAKHPVLFRIGTDAVAQFAQALGFGFVVGNSGFGHVLEVTPT
jgi:hypothetical protein